MAALESAEIKIECSLKYEQWKWHKPAHIAAKDFKKKKIISGCFATRVYTHKNFHLFLWLKFCESLFWTVLSQYIYNLKRYKKKLVLWF